MSLPRYPSYKDSGVEWLGEVPGHWVVTALKRGFDVTLGKMLQPESSSPDDELLPYLRAANIQWGGVDTTDIKQMWLSKRDRAQLRLESGDLLVSEGGDVGRSCLWEAELDNCYFQNSVNRVRARNGQSNRYLYYWMSTIKDKGYIDVLCNKSTIAHFTAEKVAAVPVPLPTPAEQTKIAAFLDRETAKIDALVAEQRRLMELLKEKRQAVISHAVTQGLNPHAPMKPSGIEWLGEVPAYWSIEPFKRQIERNDGGVWGDDPDGISDTFVLRSTEQTADGHWKIDDPAPRKLSESEINGSLLAEDDLLLTKSSGSSLHIGKTTLVTAEIAAIRCCYSNFMQRIRMKSTFLPKLAWHVMNNDLARLQFDLLSNSSTGLANLNATMVGQIVVPVPPLPEQIQIAAFLDRETAKFDTLTTEAQRAIDLLQERRTALISAAVTGQIDVRVLAPA
ncbi:MAG: restriction endonuclease subunit S [Gallionella sp.]|nr:restriction endonuclease subunit S [Gallionella sp.]